MFVGIREIGIGESHVKRDVQSTVKIIIIVIRHTLALLTYPRPRFRHFVTRYRDYVTVQMLYVQRETYESVLHRNSYVRVKIVSNTLEYWVGLCAYSEKFKITD